MSAGDELAAALAAEADAYRAIMAGADGGPALREARDRYLASHGLTGERSWGRLVGALKMAVLAGEGADGIAVQTIAETAGAGDSPSAAYARSLAQVVAGEPIDRAGTMRAGGEAFERTGRALIALAGGDGPGYAAAVAEILADFEAREHHLSGVPVADTVLVLEALAVRRGLAVRPQSALLP